MEKFSSRLSLNRFYPRFFQKLSFNLLIYLFFVDCSVCVASTEDYGFASYPSKNFKKVITEIEKNLRKYRSNMQLNREKLLLIESRRLNSRNYQDKYSQKDKPLKADLSKLMKTSEKDESAAKGVNINNSNLSLDTNNANSDVLRKKRVGMYFMPFVGINFANNFDFIWDGTGQKLEMQQKPGASFGIIAGKSFENYFMDLDFSYTRNEIDGFDREAVTPFFFKKGKTESVNLHINSGLKMPITESVDFNLGGGLGLSHHQVSMTWSGPTIKEEKSMLAYQVFTGINARVSKDFLLGLSYEWNYVPKMASFSERYMHMIRVTSGYSF